MSPFARRALSRPALDPRDETDLARQAARGDAAARQQLIEAGVRWVVLHALRRGVDTARFDDAVQDGIVALIGAVDRFDPDRGVRLATFAWRAIDGAMCRVEPADLPLADRDIPDVSTVSADDLLDGLHDADLRVLRYRFGLDGTGVARSRREVADLLGASESQVRRWEAQALRRLRRLWDAPGVASLGQGC